MFKLSNIFKPKMPDVNKEESLVVWFLQNDEKISDLRNKFPWIINNTKETIIKILNTNRDATSLRSQFLSLHREYHEKALPNTFPIVKKYGNTLPPDQEALKILGAESMIAAILRVLGYFLEKKYNISPKEIVDKNEASSNDVSVAEDYYIKKMDLIKDLAKKRIESIQSSDELDLYTEDISSMPEEILMGLPEATIVTIVDNSIIRKLSLQYSDEEIFESIENERSAYDDYYTELPTPLNLTNYISYRVEKEHFGTKGLDIDFIEFAIGEIKFLCQSSFNTE